MCSSFAKPTKLQSWGIASYVIIVFFFFFYNKRNDRQDYRAQYTPPAEFYR